MFVHKDIIIVFLFLFVVSLILLIIFIKDLKIISKSLQNFKGSAVRSDKVFFFNLFQPLIFNLNLIIKNLNEKSKFSRLRIFFYDYFFQFFPDPLLIIDQNNIIIEKRLEEKKDRLKKEIINTKKAHMIHKSYGQQNGHRYFYIFKP